MPSADGLLAAYDTQLRTEAETPSAVRVDRLGPLRLVTFAGGRGFVTYADLGGADAATIRGWVAEALEYFRDQPEITRVEWKTRGHDVAPGLDASLLDNGFVPDEPESVMIGETARLAVDVVLPEGVSLRRVSDEPDVRAMCVMESIAFGDDDSEEMTQALLRRLGLDDGMELWVAEAGGQMISAGRLEPVAGTEFAGLWGGATLPQWRRRGIYRALTAARAHSALALQKTLLHSDSTEFSRPILERSGLIEVTTTTPYEWRR
jgi:ribosomal protein S18 acetylase RimI-like enzyme